ncbi:MAG TPA: hypothetical protein VMU10_12880 [Desulfomonilia bacterium]|nr:hypothetical protein [Desulfomonilia bacterium]
MGRTNSMYEENSTGQTHGSIFGEILRTPVYKDILRLNLNEASPESVRGMVKDLMGQDPEVFLGIASSLPKLINALSCAFSELALQLKEKYPPELLKSFLESLYEDLDKEGMKQGIRAWADLVVSLWKASPELRRATLRYLLASGPSIKAGAINAVAATINTLHREDPQAVGTFISEVLKNIHRDEAGRATHTLACALLDQKWHLLSWVWNLAKQRIRKRFGFQRDNEECTCKDLQKKRENISGK